MTQVVNKRRNRDTEIEFRPKTEVKLEKIQRALEGNRTLLTMIKEGDIPEDEVLEIQRLLEINGYSKEDMFHLPYSFISRILGSDK